MGTRRVGPDVIMGRGSYFAGHPRLLWNKYGAKVRIGNWTSISSGVSFLMGGHHKHQRVTTFCFSRKNASFSKGDIVIGSDCWIGAEASILDGVTIGDGAVVGFKSVVARNVPPYAVVVGNPAKIIRYRFKPHEIDSLLRIAWWDWPIEDIYKAWPLLSLDDPMPFIEKYARPQ